MFAFQILLLSIASSSLYLLMYACAVL